MEQRYELMASREERHGRMKRLTKMFHHTYFQRCTVETSAGQDRGVGGGCDGCGVGGGERGPLSNKAMYLTDTHTHTCTNHNHNHNNKATRHLVFSD